MKTKKVTTVTAQLRMGYPSFSHQPDKRVVALELTDRSSGTMFIDAEIPAERFIDALLGHREVTVDLEFRPQLVGCIREHKTVKVPFDCYKGRDRKEEKAAALKPFEVDGWLGDEKDLENGHRRVKGAKDQALQEVAFIRYLRDGVPVDLSDQTEQPDTRKIAQLFLDFLATLPKGWLGKTTGDIGILNEAYIAARRAGLKV